MILGILKFILIALAVLFLSACNFVPLYQSSSISNGLNKKAVSTQFAQISFSEPNDRASQIVFRELGFWSNSDNEKIYRLEVNVTQNSHRITTTTSANPRIANIATSKAHFTLQRISDEAIIIDEHRFAQAIYNTTGQVVADEQAQINAQERAARTLAELIRTRLLVVLSQDEIVPIEPKSKQITSIVL